MVKLNWHVCMSYSTVRIYTATKIKYFLRSAKEIKTKISFYWDLKKPKQASKTSAGKAIWFQLTEATHHPTSTKDTTAYNKQALQFDVKVDLKERYITWGNHYFSSLPEVWQWLPKGHKRLYS